MNTAPGTAAPDAERTFLGSILQLAQVMAPAPFGQQQDLTSGFEPAALLALLKEEDFSLERFQLVYRAMSELAAERVQLDPFTVVARLERIRPSEKSPRNAAEIVDEGWGCLTFIAGLDANVIATPQLCESYAETVRGAAVVRKALALAATLEMSIRTEGLGPGISRIAAELGVLAADAKKFKPKPIHVFAESAALAIREARQSERFPGFATEIPEVDSGIVGLCRKTLSVIGGTPGSGKTAFALQLAHLIATRGGRVFIASLEMSGEMLAYRLACARHRIPLSALISGQISDWQMEQIEDDAERIRKLPMVVDDETSKVEDLIGFVRAEARAGNPFDLAIMDYLQIGELAGGPRGYGREDLKNSAICQMWKDVGKETNAHSMVLSQLNKQHLGTGGSKKPSVHQLKDGGGWQEADLAALLYRPWAQTMEPDATQEERGETFLLVGKNRIASPCEITIHFDGGAQTFSSPSGGRDL
jgi:replicative DNA helicase